MEFNTVERATQAWLTGNDMLGSIALGATAYQPRYGGSSELKTFENLVILKSDLDNMYSKLTKKEQAILTRLAVFGKQSAKNFIMRRYAYVVRKKGYSEINHILKSTVGKIRTELIRCEYLVEKQVE